MIQDIFAAAAAWIGGLTHSCRVYLTRSLVNPPRKRNGKRKIVTFRQVNHLYLFPLVLIYNELILRILNGTGILGQMFYPVVFAIALGFFLNACTTHFPSRINRGITTGILAVTAVLYIAECLIRNSFQNYMTISSALKGAGGVITGYGGELIRSLIGGIGAMFLFFLPVLIYVLVGRRMIRARQYRLNFLPVQLALGIIFMTLGCVTASHGASRLRYTTQYEFDTAVVSFGLPTAVRLSMIRSADEAVGFRVEEEEPAEESLQSGETLPEETGEAAPEESVSAREISAAADTSPNVMNVDLDSLKQGAKQNLVDVLDYIQSQSGSRKNAYTGLFRGKNLILISAEAFSDAAVSEKLTPTLYRLMHKGFYFSDYYQPSWGGSTITGEMSLLTGLVPVGGVDCIYKTVGDNQYFTMGNQLQRQNYFNAAFHSGAYDYYKRQKTHQNFGYGIWCATHSGLEDIAGSYPNDDRLINATLEYYKDQQPFSLYYMTMSGHAPYVADGYPVKNNLDTVKAIVGSEYEEKTLYYLCYQYELEVAMTNLIGNLEKWGIADDTVICLTSDHYPYGLREGSSWENDKDYVSDLYKGPTDTVWEHDHNALIIWSGCLENDKSAYAGEISEPTYSLDILPTLSNLFGLEFDSRMLVGRDVFAGGEPLVLWGNGSWVTEKGCYDAKSGEYTAKDGQPKDEAYNQRISNIVTNKINFSKAVRNLDLYGKIFGPDTDTDSNLKTGSQTASETVSGESAAAGNAPAGESTQAAADGAFGESLTAAP